MESGTPQAQLLWQIEFQIKILLDKIATGQRGARLDTKEQQQAKRQQPAHYRLFQVEPIWARAMQLGIPGVPKWDGERQTAAEVVYQLQELAACVRAVAAPASSGSETNVQPKRVLTTPVAAEIDGKDGSSDDPASLKATRSAALQCLDSCEALLIAASTNGHLWLVACEQGHIQTLIERLAEAIEKGQGIKDERRLILGPERTFGDVTGRNAHMAALILGRKLKGVIDLSVSAHSSPATEDLRGTLWNLSRGQPKRTR